MGVTTGNIVTGTVPGLKNQFGGAALMYVASTPAGSVVPAPPTSAPSGAVVAYDSANDQFYRNTTGATWVKLGSVS